MKKLLICGFILATITSCGGKEDHKDISEEAQSKSDGLTELQQKANVVFGTLPLVAENPDNPLNDEKVALGKKLYFDEILSKDTTQSCNTCHSLDAFGVDNNAFSEGNDGELGGRNSPTTFNAALHFVQFWDGREPDVEAQAGGPILNPVEMAMPSEEAVIKRLSGVKEYVGMFLKAFPEDKNPITYDNLKKAIGAFERKLITPSVFDKYLAGDESALSNSEIKGLETFIDVGCIACHTGNLLGGNMYQKFGVFGDYWDYTKSEKIDNGRSDVTNSDADKYFFKVPSLRNIAETYPYFHDGSVQGLKEAVSIMGKSQLNKVLTEKEIDDIVAFLKTLTGDVPDGLKE